jgi:hypothetical protein
MSESAREFADRLQSALIQNDGMHDIERLTRAIQRRDLEMLAEREETIARLLGRLRADPRDATISRLRGELQARIAACETPDCGLTCTTHGCGIAAALGEQPS